MKATILSSRFYLRQSFIACIFSFFYFSPFQAMSVTDPITEPSSWTKLVCPTVYLNNLSKEDADEQRRDWLLMAVVAREMPDSTVVNLQNALYDLTPLRHVVQRLFFYSSDAKSSISFKILFDNF